MLLPCLRDGYKIRRVCVLQIRFAAGGSPCRAILAIFVTIVFVGALVLTVLLFGLWSIVAGMLALILCGRPESPPVSAREAAHIAGVVVFWPIALPLALFGLFKLLEEEDQQDWALDARDPDLWKHRHDELGVSPGADVPEPPDPERPEVSNGHLRLVIGGKGDGAPRQEHSGEADRQA